MNIDQNTDLSTLANRVGEIASRMAGFKSALDSHVEDVDPAVGNSLSMLAGFSEYINIELGMIGERLLVISKQ